MDDEAVQEESETRTRRERYDIFNSAITVVQTIVIALGAGLGGWGVVNLLEGYVNDNPGAQSQGMKHVVSDLM